MIEARRSSGALGAEISGVDLARPLSSVDFGEIKRLWLEHLVLFFKHQKLNETQYLLFAERFGGDTLLPTCILLLIPFRPV